MKNSKFIPLYETIYNRYGQGGGFLEGDLVKLKANYKTLEAYKQLNDSLKSAIEAAEKSGYNIRLGRLLTPNNNAGALGINNKLPPTHADIHSEKAPGMFANLICVPIDILEAIDTGVSLSPVSKNNVRPNGDYQKPGEWKSNPDTPETKEENHLGHKQNWVEKGDYKLGEKDAKSSVGANNYDDSKPSTKYKPLPKNKLKPKTLKESIKSLEDAYMSIFTEDVGMTAGGEDVVGEENETKFIKAVADAAEEGKKSVVINGKEVPVKMDKKTADKIEGKKEVDECETGMPGNPAVSQETGQESLTQGEDGPYEEAADKVRKAYLPGGHPEDGVTIKAHPNSYLS